MLSRQEWSIPKVQPVARPGVFSIDGVISWLETMPADQSYDYHDCRGGCFYGQYLAAHGLSWSIIVAGGFEAQFMRLVYREVAHAHPWTFGSALDRARSAQRGG